MKIGRVEKEKVTELVKKLFDVAEDYEKLELFVALNFMRDSVAKVHGFNQDMAIDMVSKDSK